jgi:23S rRNA pseudouridine2605 synthase
MSSGGRKSGGRRAASNSRPRAGESMRLQRALSLAGVASRRQAEAMIEEGRVSVNGKIVREMGVVVSGQDTIRVDGRIIERGVKRRYVLLNKPPGMICTLDDPQDRPKVVDLLPKRFGRIYPVGRLDYNSEGVLLLTDDGDLAHRLTHPRYAVEKVYHVKVRAHVDLNDERFKQLASGKVTLEDGSEATLVRVALLRQTERSTWLELVLTEGKNREIRRICSAVGLEVARLVRQAFGPMLTAGLQPGAWRELNAAEVHELKRLVGLN